MEKIQINLQLSLKDIEELKNADKQEILRYQKKFSIYFMILLLIGTAGFAYYLFSQIPDVFISRPFHMATIFFLMILVGVLLNFVCILIITMKRNRLIPFFMKNGEERIRRMTEYVHSFEISEEGLKVASSESSSFIKWNSLYKIIELSSYLLIHPSPWKFHVLPLHSFSNQNLLNEFLKLISEKADRKKLCLKKNRTSAINFTTEKAASPIFSKPESTKSLFEIDFSLSKADIILTEFKNSSSQKKVFSLIPALSSLVFLFGFILSLFGVSFFDAQVALIGAGFCFIFTPITMIMYNIIYKMIPTENGYFQKRNYSCKFYTDTCVIHHSGNIETIARKDLIGDKETIDANGFYFLDTTINSVVLPKNVFDGKTDIVSLIKQG